MDVLVVEDEVEVCATIRLGWPVPSDRLRFISTYRQSLNLTQGAELRFFDAIVLDIHLPDGDGMTILRTIRHSVDIPVVLISGSGNAESRAAAFDAGADDYVMKPFSVRELQARVARLVTVRDERRRDSVRADNFMIGNVECSLTRRQLQFDEKTMALTDAEMRIVEYLNDNLGKTCSKSAIFKNVFFRDFSPGDKTLDVYVSRLRRKLGDLDSRSADALQTARGFGYKLSGL